MIPIFLGFSIHLAMGQNLAPCCSPQCSSSQNYGILIYSMCWLCWYTFMLFFDIHLCFTSILCSCSCISQVLTCFNRNTRYFIQIPWLPTRLTFPWCYFGSAGWRHHLGAMAMAMAAMVGESLILALGYPWKTSERLTYPEIIRVSWI